MKIVSKNIKLDKEMSRAMHDLYEFMKNEYNISDEPEFEFLEDEENAKEILCRTGFYDPSKKKVSVYVLMRHPKDILRSIAHELIHHVQNMEGLAKPDKMAGTADPNYILHDEYLKNLEEDAFKRGNLCFRKWEATKKGGKQMNEEKKMPKAKVVKAHEKAKEAMPSFKKQYGAEKGEKIAYATMMKRAKKGELEEEAKPDYLDLDGDGDKEESMKKAADDKKKEEMKENKEVEINPALKNSHHYVPEDRAMAEAYNARDERIYNELLKKFKIKK